MKKPPEGSSQPVAPVIPVVPVIPVIGWREWVTLPGSGLPAIKAKVDTGARSSSIHAVDVRTFRRGGRRMVRFGVHPHQRRTDVTVIVEAPLLEFRCVRSSGGQETERPVVLAEIELMGRRLTVELTLAARDSMGFRMLLGRQALRGRFMVDPGRSYYAGRPSAHGRTKKKTGDRAAPGKRNP